MLLLLLLAATLGSTCSEEASSQSSQQASKQQTYGVDHSFPIHHATVKPHAVDPTLLSSLANAVGITSDSTPNALKHNVQAKYDNFMQGCHEKYAASPTNCDTTERDRIRMNLRQPSSMQNYTEMGFKKMRLDEDLFQEILEWWERNKKKEAVENWPKGNTYVNHWESPTYMISLDSSALRGGRELKKRITETVKGELEEWTDNDITPTSLYGIRVYKSGSMLAPHVDRMPLVTSAIIQVAQSSPEGAEPWSLEVYDHGGTAHNITMDVGDLVLYESHSVIHGRPFPFTGDFYANIFVHFEPTGHSERHDASASALKAAAGGAKNVEAGYKASKAGVITGHEGSNHDDNRLGLEEMPAYLVKGSEEAQRWLSTHGSHEADTASERAAKRERGGKVFGTGTTQLHSAAQQGDVDAALDAIEGGADVHAKDNNGWQPLHEAARAGHVEVAELLKEKGADMNGRTNKGRGGTPLWLARQSLGDEHRIVEWFEAMGALDIGAEL